MAKLSDAWDDLQTLYIRSGGRQVEVRLPGDTLLREVHEAILNSLANTPQQRQQKEEDSLSHTVTLITSETPICAADNSWEDLSGISLKSEHHTDSFALLQSQEAPNHDDHEPSEIVLVMADSLPQGKSYTSSMAFSEAGSDPSLHDLSRLRGSALYSYMWLSFQWVEPQEQGTYHVLPVQFYEAMRVFVALSLWLIVGFELYNLIHGFHEFSSDVTMFTALVAVVHRLFWTLRYLVLHHLGVYFFNKHQDTIQDILALSTQISATRWRALRRHLQDLMAASGFFLLFLPLMQKLIPIFIQTSQHLPRHWDATVECVEFFVLIYSRILAMPSFFFLILAAEVHISELKSMEEKVKQCRSSVSELFREYKAMSARIDRSSHAFQIYLVGLLFLLVFWGTLSAYSSVEIFKKLPSTKSSMYGVMLSEGLGTFTVFLCETVFLFSLPLLKLGKITSCLQHLIFVVTTLDCDQQEREGFAFNDEHKILQFSHRLEKYQTYGSLGFKVLGLHITKLKSIWLSLLGPIIAFVGNLLLNEHF